MHFQSITNSGLKWQHTTKEAQTLTNAGQRVIYQKKNKKDRKLKQINSLKTFDRSLSNNSVELLQI
jgi:hypothetical protein